MVEFFGIFSSKVIPISSLRTGATWTKIPLVALRGQLLEKHYDQKPVKGYRHLWTNVSFYFVKEKQTQKKEGNSTAQTGTAKASATRTRMSSVLALQFSGALEMLVHTSP